MKLNFSIDMTPDEFTSLANAEVEAQRIREGLRRDRDFSETESYIKEMGKEVERRVAEFEKYYAKISQEIEEAKKKFEE